MIDELEAQVKVVNCQGREIVCREYGSGNAQTVLAVHGLGGQGVNFEPLAQALCSDYRVICPDLIGRGRSQWAEDPDREYCFANYKQLLGELLAQLEIDQFHWVGTSMGGALGIRCAGGAWRGRIKSLVLNDIGPEIDAGVLAEIATAIAEEPRFNSYTELAEGIAAFLGSWAGQPNDMAHWMRFALQGARRCDDGRLALHHDPKIGRQFACHEQDYQNWQGYHAIECPVLVIRGTLSRVLSPSVAAQMTRSGPTAQLVTLEGWGHAPFLDAADQVKMVAEFIRQH